MKSYIRPVILANEELSEGVYAASGAVESTGGVSVSDVVQTGWGNPDYKNNKYKVTIVNSGNEALKDWSASISVVSGTVDSVIIYNGWFASASADGDKIVITSGPGGEIAAGGSLDIDVDVFYKGDSISIGK